MRPIPAIILAAGESSRLGRPKQLLMYKGKNLLQHTIQTVQTAHFAPVIVVLGAFRDLIEPTIANLEVEQVYNKKWKEGMGGSLKTGIEYLLTNYPDSPACLTLLCDQPLLIAQHLGNLATQWEKGTYPIVATQYGGIKGVPIIWDASYFPQLAKVEGQIGARKLLKTYASDVETVIFEPAAKDVDTWEDYQSLED